MNPAVWIISIQYGAKMRRTNPVSQILKYGSYISFLVPVKICLEVRGLLEKGDGSGG